MSPQSKKEYCNMKSNIIPILFVFSLLGFFTSTVAQAQCQPSGDQQSYGQNQWIAYVYAGTTAIPAPPANVAATTYRGFFTQSCNFNLDFSTGAIAGTNICGSYADNYTVRMKMQRTFAAGYYALTVGGDDSYRLSIDGGTTFIDEASDWTLHTYTTKTVTVYLSGTVNFVFEYFEKDGASQFSFNHHTVSCESSAPTAISGNTALSCSNATTTLTATGGSSAPGSTYQWGTGPVAGQNVISGAVTASLSVSPAVTTVYWVRRVNGAPCTGTTDAATITVTVADKPGNPQQFGNNVWAAYGYSGANLNLSGTTYQGYYTQATLGFDTVTGTNSWDSAASPSASAGWQGCSVPNDNFTLVYKRQGFPCGRYTLTMKRWDEEAVLYVNGVQVWYKPVASVGIDNNNVGTFDLDGSSTIEVRIKEATGNANAVLTLIPASVPPTYIAVSYGGTTATLTAGGGTVGGGAVYQWGTGSIIGENIVEGATGPVLSVTTTTATTYWVRLANYTQCTPFSTAVTTQVAPTTSQALANPDITGEQREPVVYCSGKVLSVTGTTQNIKSVEVFDLSGRLVVSDKVSVTAYNSSFIAAQGPVIIVRIQYDNDAVLTKKVVFK